MNKFHVAPGVLISLALTLLLPACADQLEPGSQQQALQQACFTTPTSILCLHSEASEDPERLRQRVEDFYPSACFDGDQDEDGLLDTFDLDSDGDSDDPLGCETCNRGPGTQTDFRLDIEGDQIELDRGTVSAITDTSLDVPTPDGLLTIVWTDATEFEDGQPGPGAEIRARGYIDESNTFIAERLKVLCPGAAPMDEDEVPEGAEPPTEGDGPIIL